MDKKYFINEENKMLVEVCGRYTGNGRTTRVLATINGHYAEITRRQERAALRRVHAIGGDFLVCSSAPKGWTDDLPNIWIKGCK